MSRRAHQTPRLTALDTNILARYYVQAEPSDAATAAQCEAARAVIESGRPLFVPKTVVLELEWVLRGFYRAAPKSILAVMEHLLAMPHAQLEDRLSIELACKALAQGLDFADALHHASSRACDEMVTFDDKGFSQRAQRLGLVPRVIVPKSTAR